MTPMHGNGRSFAILELMKEKDAPMEMGGGDNDFLKKAPMHCEKGLKMARTFLDSPEGEDSPLRPQVEALAEAYEGMLEAVGSSGDDEMGEEEEDY